MAERWIFSETPYTFSVSGERCGRYGQICRLAISPLSDHADEARRLGRLIASSPDLLNELRSLSLAYVKLLEAGRERITFLGGHCDSVADMEEADPALRSARAAIAKASPSTPEEKGEA